MFTSLHTRKIQEMLFQITPQINQIKSQTSSDCQVLCQLPYNIKTGQLKVHHLYTGRGLWNAGDVFSTLIDRGPTRPESVACTPEVLCLKESACRIQTQIFTLERWF